MKFFAWYLICKHSEWPLTINWHRSPFLLTKMKPQVSNKSDLQRFAGIFKSSAENCLFGISVWSDLKLTAKTSNQKRCRDFFHWSLVMNPNGLFGKNQENSSCSFCKLSLQQVFCCYEGVGHQSCTFDVNWKILI